MKTAELIKAMGTLRDEELRPLAVEILVRVYDAGTIPQAELVRRTKSTEASVSRNLKKLQGLKLIELYRDLVDVRTQMVRIAIPGRRTVDAMIG